MKCTENFIWTSWRKRLLCRSRYRLYNSIKVL